MNDDLISKSNFDKRVREAVGMTISELTADFKDGVRTTLELLKTEPTVDAVPFTDVDKLKMRVSGAEAAINGMREQINRMIIINSEKVSVVRCKDCKHSYHTQSDYSVILACSELDDREVDPDWYCADGERKVDELSDS